MFIYLQSLTEYIFALIHVNTGLHTDAYSPGPTEAVGGWLPYLRAPWQ